MAELINNRYKIIRQLGKGGMGTVYLVEDTLQNDQVLALKTIRAGLLGERSLSQFKYEFAALGQLRHPNLVAVHDFGAIAGSRDYFFTMEYVPGQDLPALIAQAQPGLDYEWLYGIVVQLCRALQYIHSRGFIHYDVKPRNVRVTPEGQVKLMDFGLIGEARGEGQLKVRGTPEYIAPELIRGDPVDRRADLYSLGVSLYEIVTGHLPFSDTSSMLILRQHVEAAPELPRGFAPDIPEGLQALILKLMAKEPANRYGSADAVIQAINELSGLAFPVETKETKRGYIQSGRFVGREFELARLQGLLMRAMQGQGRLVLIAGAAGVGKTRLVRELRLRAQMQRVLVCEGACREQVRTPYHPWVFSILSQVISHQQARAAETVQAYGAALVKLMPELAGQVDDAAHLPPAPTDKAGLLDAVARFLLACDVPLVLILEDLQYADPETIELLDYVGQRAPQGRLLLCGIYRDDEIDPAHPLNAIALKARLISRQRESRTPASELLYDLLRLNPLTEADVTNLVKSMLGLAERPSDVARPETLLPAGLVPRLMAETGGNPLFIESVMHNLVEEDVLQYDGQAWRIDVTNLVLPANIQEAAQRRLRRLAERPDSLELLQWVAAMGQWLDMDVLMTASGLPPERVLGLVNEAVQQHVLTAGEQAGQPVYRFSTDPMRDAVYSTLSAEQRAERHRRIGQALRMLYAESDVAEWLAWHFERAGDLRLALQYARLAADKARQTYATESAIRHYGRALELLHGCADLADPQMEFALLAGREGCYDLLGERQAQQADLNRMARLAQSMGDVARQIEVITRQVAVANLLGNNVEAQQAAEAALRLVRQAGDRKLEADCLSSLGRVYFGLSDYAHALDCHEQALRLYEELGDQAGQARNLWQIGDLIRRSGQAAQAQDYLERALALYRALGDRNGESDALNALGNWSNDYARQRTYYEESLAIARAIGNRDAESRAYNNLAMTYWALGLYGRARDYMEPAVQIERELHGRSSLVLYLETLGRIYLDMGDYAQAQQAFEEGRVLAMDVGDRETESLHQMMLGRVALARGQLNEARQLIGLAADMQREIGAGALGYRATSLAWLGATHLGLGDWEAARRCTSEAVAQLEATGHAGDYPAQDVLWLHYQVLKAAPPRARCEALDEEAWTCLQRAHAAMLQSIATLSDEGLRRNYLNKVKINSDIVTEWTRQSARRAGAGAPALPEVEHGGAAEAERVRDKLKRVLDISLQMNETHDADLLLNYVMDQVIELSGAERGFLVLLDEAGQMNFAVARGMAQDEIERAKAQISYTVLGAVTQSRAPVLLQDAMTDERFGRQSSVLELNLRSVLCVPLLTRSELAGMIYADNRSVTGRFSQADVDLLTIFANQAATAIENARLYQETLTWARTLEQRVAERTAELQQANAALSRRAMQLETSSQVGRQVTSILDLDDLLTQVVHLIQARFDYYFVGVWLAPSSGQPDHVALQAGTGRAEALPEAGLCIALDTPSVIVDVCKTGQARRVDDVSAAPDYLALEGLPAARSELALPLRLGELVVGALDILSDRPAAFGPDDVMVLQTLADQITIAIRNAQFYKTEQTRRRWAESLERAGRELSSNLDLRQVPGRILEQLASVVPYERGAVLVQRDHELHIIARYGFPADAPAELTVSIQEGDVFQQVVQSGRPVVIDDVTASSGWQQLEWLPVNKSWLGAPLISRERVIGMVSLTRREAAAFGHDDATLVAAFAGQAATALENASLYDEITRFNEQLEQMVQSRTEELKQAYQTLEKLDKTKADFINVAAHELRTPLTVIRGYAQLLEKSLPASGQAGLEAVVQGIRSGVDRLHEIVNSMLDITKIDSQTLRMRKERMPLAETVESVRAGFEPALRERRLTLTTQGLESLPPILADPDLIFKVFYHLVMNAIKYTPDGGSIIVSGRALEEVGSEPEVEVVVSDTGIGIDPTHHEMIFEKFYQTGEVSFHSSGRTKFKGGGPGLGLAIARGIVTAHGGAIWVESPGYDEQRCPGSHFHVRLPVKAP